MAFVLGYVAARPAACLIALVTLVALQWAARLLMERQRQARAWSSSE